MSNCTACLWSKTSRRGRLFRIPQDGSCYILFILICKCRRIIVVSITRNKSRILMRSSRCRSLAKEAHGKREGQWKWHKFDSGNAENCFIYRIGHRKRIQVLFHALNDLFKKKNVWYVRFNAKCDTFLRFFRLIQPLTDDEHPWNV